MKNNHMRLLVSFVLAVVFTLPMTLGCTRIHVASVPPDTLPPPSAKGTPKPYRVGENWYHPLSEIRDYREKGIASWYGTDFHGKKTSSGEVYNMYGMTAAHKILPLGTYVRVKNLINNKLIEVRINDRGPFVRGRIIDLSYTAAKKLEMIGPGTVPVEIVALEASAYLNSETDMASIRHPDYFSGIFSVQVGAFQDLNNAEKLRKNLASIYGDAHITTYSDGTETIYRVRVGRYTTVDEVMATEKLLVENGYMEAFSVAD